MSTFRAIVRDVAATAKFSFPPLLRKLMKIDKIWCIAANVSNVRDSAVCSLPPFALAVNGSNEWRATGLNDDPPVR